MYFYILRIWLEISGSENRLKVKSSGDEINDMMDQAKPSELLYGYAKLFNEELFVPKFVYIIWLGSSSLNKKNIEFIKNSEEIAKLCKTIHIRISAREKNDINWKDITSRIFAGSYNKPCDRTFSNNDESLEERPENSSEPSNPSNYIMKGLVAARIKALYEQKTSSAYRPTNFREELEAARSMPHDPIDPIHGSNYERPDFMADIARRNAPGFIEQNDAEKVPLRKNSKEPKNKHKLAKSSSKKSKKVSASTGCDISSSSLGAQTDALTGAMITVSSSTEKSDIEVDGRYDFIGVCIFRFIKALDDEITILPGDRITNICKFDDAWLWGTTKDGESGRFPKSYVELFEDEAKDL
ncbi:hypothetical protein Aperf_G00000020316 [Anoplocephala perfoliata]